MTNKRATDLTGLVGKRLSSATLAFHQAVAARLGIGITDVKCRALVVENEGLSAGDLAARLGVTSGAMTGILDRLEKKRLLRRSADPDDRRRVVVQALPHVAYDRAVAALFAPLGRRIRALVRARNRNERAVIGAFLLSACLSLEKAASSLPQRVRWR